jgi:hypothetical protein
MWKISFLSHRSIPLPDLFIVCDCGVLLISPSNPHSTCSPTRAPLTGYHSLTSHSQQLLLIFISSSLPRLLAPALGPSSPSPISFSRLPFPSSPWPSLGSLELVPTSSSISTSVFPPCLGMGTSPPAPISQAVLAPDPPQLCSPEAERRLSMLSCSTAAKVWSWLPGSCRGALCCQFAVSTLRPHSSRRPWSSPLLPLAPSPSPVTDPRFHLGRVSALPVGGAPFAIQAVGRRAP